MNTASRNRNTLWVTSWLLAICCGMLLCKQAHADVGIPIVSLGFPFLVANLVFVVLIETLVLKYFQKTRPTLGIAKQVFYANLVTTFIGFPLIGMLEACSAFFGLAIGWLIPFQDLEKMHWYIGAQASFALIPCYFLSVAVEGKMLRRWLSIDVTWKQVFLANLASYLFLLCQVFTDTPVQFLSYGRYTVVPTFKFIELVHRPFESNVPKEKDFQPYED